MNLELVILFSAKLAEWQPLGSSPKTGATKHLLPCLAYYLGTGDPNSGPQAYAARTLPTESFSLALFKQTIQQN